MQSVRNEFLSAQAQERSLAEALNAQKADALSLNRKGIEYGVLRREAESNKQMYELLMQRAKETGISGELKTSNIRIVDPAEIPRSPIRPNKSRDLSLGLLAGLLGGIGLALFMEYIDNRVKNPDEIKTYPRPELPGPGARAARQGPRRRPQPPLLTEAVPQNFAEAFRTVRTNVLFSSAEQGSRSVLVTSTQPQEGKTVVTANLALALAQTGQRVLLVDADMRKPRQHELFNAAAGPWPVEPAGRKGQGERSGSEDRREQPLADAGRAEPAEPGGTAWFDAVQGPAEDAWAALRLGRDRLAAGDGGHRRLRDRPPDDGRVFVIGSEQVPRNTVRTAVEQLLASKATILGAVLNRVNIRRNPYYYAHYYKHEYAGYYSAEKTA